MSTHICVTITRLKNNNGIYNASTLESIAKGIATRIKNKTMPNKSWRIVSPAAKEFITEDLREFCSKNGLSHDTLRRHIGSSVPQLSRKVKHQETINSVGWGLHRT